MCLHLLWKHLLHCCPTGLAFTPELYRCGIAFSGMANLADFARAMPPYWGPIKNRWLLRVGNVTADEALNQRISPVFHAHNIRVPLLMGTGGNDVRVTQVRLMQNRGTYVKLPVWCTQGSAHLPAWQLT
jgi:dipeptidyl aminopeptidase/acylaminoacyl peptidase